MNDMLDDEVVITRLRSALDELTEPAGDLVPLQSRSTMTPARRMAVAAAGLLVVGAVAAVAVNLGNRPEAASTPTAPATTTPATTAPSTVPPSTTAPTLIRLETPFFVLASPDLTSGERTFEQCCRLDPLLAMAWASDGRYLTLTEYPAGPIVDVFPDADSTVRETSTARLMFRSFGLTAEERDSLAAEVIPGSGLPYLLPLGDWGMVAMGSTAGESRLLQLYTPIASDPLSSYMPTVTLSVGEYRGELDLLAQWPDPQQVTVAGYDGWKVTDSGGLVTVFWDAGKGSWATMVIDAKFADRTDGLIAAVAQIDPREPTTDTVFAP